MVRCSVHLRHLGLVVLASALTMTGACRDKKKEQQTQEKKQPAKVEGLDAVPANASVLIGLDVSKLASSSVMQRAVERMFAQDPELEGELKGVLKACALDPTSDIAYATIALVTSGDHSDSLLITKGTYREPAIIACLGRFLSESGGSLESASFEDRVIYHQVSKDAPGVWLSFGSSDTLLIASSRELLSASLGKGPKLGSVQTGLAAYLPRVNTQGSIWALGTLDPAVAAGLVQATGGQVKAPRAIVGSVALEEGLTVQLQVEMSSTDDAITLISQAKTQVLAAALILQVDGIGQLIQKIEFTSDDRWARLDWKLTETELADLIGANLSGISSSIDKDAGNVENPPPKSENAEIAGEQEDGKPNTDAGS